MTPTRQHVNETSTAGQTEKNISSAEAIARGLESPRRWGDRWVARCPAHDDHSPSLSIREVAGKVLVHCHARCDQQKVIATLKERGLWHGRAHIDSRHRSIVLPHPQQQSVNLSSVALEIWRSSLRAEDTLVEVYLATRGLTIPLHPSLRFQRGLKHPSGGFWPCMVALVSGGADDEPLAIHRTFLARDGSGKAPVDPQKMMLGPCRGGAVRLGQPGDMLMVGEGIETCLTAMQATGHPAWAALSTSGLRALDLPESVREVIVLADGDDPGEAAARDCALRWQRQGRRVRIARPPRGQDFNDMLTGTASRHREGSK